MPKTSAEKLAYQRMWYAAHRARVQKYQRNRLRSLRAAGRYTKKPPVPPATSSYDDLIICLCTHCECELAPLETQSQKKLFTRLRFSRHNPPLPRLVAGRINGRPYCSTCFKGGLSH